MLYYTRATACTSSVVAMIYEEHNIVPPVAIAGVLLSGIIGTTQILRSPRTTVEDARLVKFLSIVCGLDYEEYGKQLVEQITLNWNFENVISYDLRSFDLSFGHIKYFGFEVGTFENINRNYIDGLRDAMSNLREKCALCSFCLIANITTKCSLIVMETDNTSLIEQFAFHSQLKHWKDYKFIFEAENMLSKRAELLPLL